MKLYYVSMPYRINGEWKLGFSYDNDTKMSTDQNQAQRYPREEAEALSENTRRKYGAGRLILEAKDD